MDPPVRLIEDEFYPNAQKCSIQVLKLIVHKEYSQ